MRKNILAIAILAAVIANIILTAVMLFSIVPAAKQSNELVKRICQVIDLELENPDAMDYQKIPLSAREAIAITADGDNITILLKAGADGKQHYAQVKFTIVFNNLSSDYATITANLDNQKPMLRDYVESVLAQYSADEIIENKESIDAAVLSYCRTYFESADAIISVILSVTIG